jgi:ATP-dependent HslUV protease ATP-binding subunit HslU
MNELTVVDKVNEWRRMKSLVLDSVSSPITKRVYNMALDEFFDWYQQEPRPGFNKATVNAWRVTLDERGLGSSILPIVEGTTVNTRYGFVRTDHILFMAAGAFHVSKPADMIPELQGRFPIRVELKSLTVEDFIRILKEPKNALAKQYTALMETEGIKLTFTDDALEEVAKFAAQVNQSSENIGARRLHTIMEKLVEEVSFEGPDLKKKTVKMDAAYVRKQLADIVKDQDLSRYIL